MRGDRRRGRRLRCVVPCLILLVGCGAGPPRSRGPLYGAEDAPFLSAHVSGAIDRAEDPAHRLILLGDAGAPLRDDPTLAAVGRWADARAARSTVVFLGDNVYPAGLRESDRARGERILRQQLEATNARKLFIPGNHDWGFSALGAVQAGTLLNEERFIDAHARAHAEFAPEGGCPGPVVKTLVPPGGPLSGGLTLLVVDFHWWLLPEAERPRCPGVPDTEAFLEHLRGALEGLAGQNVVVAAHHPLRSGGPHGGLTRGFWVDLGAGIYHRLHGPLQDLWEPTYAQMVNVVSEALAEAPPLAFVAGHDHSLQVLEGGDVARLLVVSGAGSAGRITGVTAVEGTIFAHSHPGFVVFDFFASKGAGDVVLVRVVETGQAEPVFTLGIDLDIQRR